MLRFLFKVAENFAPKPKPANNLPQVASYPGGSIPSEADLKDYEIVVPPVPESFIKLVNLTKELNFPHSLSRTFDGAVVPPEETQKSPGYPLHVFSKKLTAFSDANRWDHHERKKQTDSMAIILCAPGQIFVPQNCASLVAPWNSSTTGFPSNRVAFTFRPVKGTSEDQERAFTREAYWLISDWGRIVIGEGRGEGGLSYRLNEAVQKGKIPENELKSLINKFYQDWRYIDEQYQDVTIPKQNSPYQREEALKTLLPT